MRPVMQHRVELIAAPNGTSGAALLEPHFENRRFGPLGTLDRLLADAVSCVVAVRAGCVSSAGTLTTEHRDQWPIGLQLGYE